MKSLLATLLLVFPVTYESFLFSQSQMQLTVGGTGISSDYATSVTQTSSGGFAMCGWTKSFGAGGEDVYIVNMTPSGSIQWTKTVGGAANEAGFAIMQSSDGGFVVSGNTFSFGAGGADMFIVKLDAGGNLQWSKSIGGTLYEAGGSVVQTSDGGFVVAGSTRSFGAGDSDIFIVKLDPTGALLWSITIGGTGADFPGSIVQTSDGGYTIGGSTSSFGGGGSDLYVVRLDASGTHQWSATVGGPGDDSGGSLSQLADGGYAVAGHTDSFGAGEADVYVVKLTSSGALLWAKTVGGTGHDVARSVTASADGGCAVAGWTNSFGQGLRPNDVYVAKLTGSGSVHWTKMMGSTNMADEGYEIIQTQDGKYVVAGVSAYFPLQFYDCYLGKLDANGNSCGYASKPKSLSGSGGTAAYQTPIVSSQTPVVADQTPIVSSGGAMTMICSRGGLGRLAADDEAPVEGESEIGATFQLEQNHPNPFNPSTVIRYHLATPGFVSLKVYDLLGREVTTLVNEEKAPGSYEETFDASGLPSGVYLYILKAGTFTETKKLILIR